MTDTLYLMTAFDGTGNNRYNDDLDGTTTNVGSIAKCHTVLCDISHKTFSLGLQTSIM